MEKKDKKIKYKDNTKKKNYLPNPDLYQSYMNLNTQKFGEIESNSLIKNFEEKSSLNAQLPSGILSMDAKIMNKKKREGD
ncbi:MAG: hypothetical protein ACFE8M_03695 [Candidatus Hermodarchaeota archaeon]